MVIYNSHTDKRPEKIDITIKLADSFYAQNKDVLKYCIEEDIFYKYSDGYYKPMYDIQTERYFMDNAVGEFEPINYLKPSSFSGFIRRYKAISQVPLDQFNKGELFNFNNGVFDLASGSFFDHKPEYLFTIRFPYNYDPQATAPTWELFLNTSLEGDTNRITVLQDFFGYCLGRDTGFHKALILIGEGRNGKGITLGVIKNILGDNNYSTVTIDKISKPEVASNLVGKLVNIDADMDSHAEKFEAVFRMITASDEITVKKLYKDYFQFKPFCKFIMSANDLPRISDKTRGFYDRLMIIPFNVSFAGREDFYLASKLKAETSGIFNWALEGRKRLYERGRFLLSGDLANLIEDVKRENNPVVAFVDEYVGFGEVKNPVTKVELYELYNKFCRDNGHCRSSKIRFGKEFYRIAGSRTIKEGRDMNRDNAHVWKGVYIKNGVSDPDNKDEQVVWDN